MGFHVKEHKIKYIAERAYAGLREYMRSFVDKPNSKQLKDLERKCSDDYSDLMKTFSGYWS